KYAPGVATVAPPGQPAIRGNRGPALVIVVPPLYPPQAAASGRRWSVTAPLRPRRSQIVWVVLGRAGEANTVTMRSASSASPMIRSTSAPGSSFHGSLASRWALVARIRLHVESSARAGETASHPAAAPANASA